MNPMSLKERQECAKSILVCFADYCKNNNLTYTLEFGTLLGAVRHKGFIPWDDDIDIGMPRSDYEKIVAYKKISDTLFIDNYGDGNEHDTNFAKVYDSRTYAITDTGQKRCGVYIDIFPLDYIPDQIICRMVQKIELFYFYSATKLAEYPTRKAQNKVLQLIYHCFSKLFQTKGRAYYAKRLNQVASKWNEKSELLSVLIEPDKINKRIISKNEYYDIEEVSYDGDLFSISKCYDKKLKMEYGDYMKLPSENERLGHFSYTFYRKE